MSRAKRGGLTLKTGKIGRWNCLRQQILMPGEKMDISIQGSVRLETLRERDVMRINAMIVSFIQPLRWLFSDFPQYLKEGPDTSVTPPTITSETNWDKYGIGSYKASGAGTMYQFYRDAVLRCYNEWMKHPEDADITSWNNSGGKAVPLSKPWSRARYDMTPDAAADYTIDVSGSTMDVRDLAEVEAKFRGAMKRDNLSFNRWIELINEVYKGDGSREVDQVPIMLDQAEVGVNPREMPATDGASLGQWQSMFDFNIDHQIPGVVAPEHSIVSHFLCVRFAPVIEGCMPLAADNLDWHELTGDPEFLTAAQPVPVEIRDFTQSTSSTQVGYLPAGWQWRCDHDVIGKAIDIRDSFPYMLNPSTQAECKDATRVKDAFRSQALDDYVVDVYFREDSRQPIGTSLESYFSGMLDDVKPGQSNTNDEFPKGGKSL
jgi:hypothetical protein